MDSSSSIAAPARRSQGRLSYSLAPTVHHCSVDNIPAAPLQLRYGLWEIVGYDTLCLELHASDGRPVLQEFRGGNGTSSRFTVLQVDGLSGFLDITDLGAIIVIQMGAKGWQYVNDIEELATQYCSTNSAEEEGKASIICQKPLVMKVVNALDINGCLFTFPKLTNAQLVLTVDKDHRNCVKVMSTPADVLTGTNTIHQYTTVVRAPLVSFPDIIPADIELLKVMMDIKLVPYQNMPSVPGKTDEEIEKLGKQFFGPFTVSSFELAMSLYDWTSASFFRLLLFKHFVYTAILPDTPLDMGTIADMIWQSDWGSYNPQDVDFMHSLLMNPATSLEDVQVQLQAVADELRVFVDAQCRLISAGLLALPRISVKAIPKLYSGQVDVYQYTTSRFLPLFLEFPGNKGLQQPLIASQLKVGNILTSKACVSFTTTKEDALHYANGILLTLSPPKLTPPCIMEGAAGIFTPTTRTWPKGGYVTPLSNDPNKIEYVMPPLTRFSIINTNFQDEQLALISLRLLLD